MQWPGGVEWDIMAAMLFIAQGRVLSALDERLAPREILFQKTAAVPLLAAVFATKELLAHGFPADRRTTTHS
jgi:hypothetical protein